MAMLPSYKNYDRLSIKGKYDKILERNQNRALFYERFCKMFAVCKMKGIRMVVENPWYASYLRGQNFEPPTIVDENRMMRGDYMVKPTAYWFVGCSPTNGCTIQKNKVQKHPMSMKHGIMAGMCSEERSMISPDYARNFICDFILGKDQIGSQLSIF